MTRTLLWLSLGMGLAILVWWLIQPSPPKSYLEIRQQPAVDACIAKGGKPMMREGTLVCEATP